MSRYCLISQYKKYLNSLNNIKDNCKYTNISKEVGLINKNTVENRTAGSLNKLISNISRLGSKFHNTANRTLCGAKYSKSEEEHLPQTKYVRTKVLKKEVKKLYVNLQKQLVNNKFAWTAAGVTAVDTSLPIIENKPVASSATSDLTFLSDPIPEPPPVPVEVPEVTEEIVNQLNALGEPTFASLGLGGYSPVGIAQTCFEYLHASLGLQWWVAVAIGTIIIRLAMFPLVVISQRNAAKMNNYLPQLQLLQMKMTEARQTGNAIESARYSHEMMEFMKEKNLNPLKNMLVPLAQAPIFISFFIALRQMANVPVESLTTGGMLWFLDLTIPDQYYLLPLITSVTLWITIEVGTDAGKLTSQQGVLMKYVLRGLPILIFPFTMNFPGVILCYWVSTNFISLLQVGFLRIPTVRQYFNIEAMRRFDPTTLPQKQKGFSEGLKDAWTNMKLTKEFEERKKLDERSFRRAGNGPIVKTYKYDPTKQTSPSTPTPMSAKKR